MSGSRVFSLLLLCGVLLSVRLKAQTLHVCADQVEHSTCEIVCITPDHAQTVAFYKLPNTGTEIAQCISFVGCFNTSPYTITQPNSTATVLTFILTRSLIGSYRCNYGSLFSNETLHWGTYPSNTLVTGVTNGSEIESVDEFMVYLHCFYSEHEPTITLFYKDEQGNVDATSDLFSCANSTTSSCPHDSDFTSYDCPCRLRHKTGIDCKDIYDVNGYITISNIESMWNTSIVDDITFPCQSTDSCDSNCWICFLYILLAIFIASGISTLVVVLSLEKKGKETHAQSLLYWLADRTFCCCAQKIKSFCEKYQHPAGVVYLVYLLFAVFVIGMLVSFVIWLVALVVVICTCCACAEWPVKFAVAVLSLLFSFIACLIWTAIVLKIYDKTSCCKNNGYHKLRSKYKTKEAGDNINLLEQRTHEFKKIKSIDLTKDGEKVSSDEYEVGMTACPSLTLKMVSLDQSGKYECTISYDLAQKEVHQLNLLVTPKQYEVKMGDKKTLLKFLKNLKDIEDVTWTHNYETIPADTCFYKGGTRSNPSLTVKYCSTSDSGLYICNIRTKQGSKRFSAQLNITVTDEIKVDVGGKKTLLENLISNNKDFEDVKWYHKRQPIPHNCDFSYDAEPQNRSALTINLVTAKMAGQYKCIVKSTKNAEIKVFKVQVKVLDNFTVDSGKNIDLLKDLSSYHGIKQISWVLNGKPLKLAENPSYIGGTKDRPVLTVYCATKEESGKYKCTLEFESQPTKELNFKLNVNEQWQVDSGDSIVLLDKLESSFDGTSVVWTHKKKPVKCFHKGGTDQCPTLTIPVVSLEDSGEYECKLTLQHGKIRLYRFVLKVNEKENSTRLGPVIRNNRVRDSTENNQSWTEEEQ